MRPGESTVLYSTSWVSRESDTFSVLSVSANLSRKCLYASVVHLQEHVHWNPVLCTPGGRMYQLDKQPKRNQSLNPLRRSEMSERARMLCTQPHHFAHFATA